MHHLLEHINQDTNTQNTPKQNDKQYLNNRTTTAERTGAEAFYQRQTFTLDAVVVKSRHQTINKYIRLNKSILILNQPSSSD